MLSLEIERQSLWLVFCPTFLAAKMEHCNKMAWHLHMALICRNFIVWIRIHELSSGVLSDVYDLNKYFC